MKVSVVRPPVVRTSSVSLSTVSNNISSEAVRPILLIFHIIASIGRGNEKLCFLFQSNKNSSCYGNL